MFNSIMYNLKKLFKNINEKSKAKEYDKITGVDVIGKVKAVTTTDDCSYFKEITNKEKNGLISLDKLLDDELSDSNLSDIYLCDNEKTICLHNHLKNSYVEIVYEAFDSATDKVYLVCATQRSYDIAKEFIQQSSKYHSCINYVKELPNNKAFKEIFSIQKKVEKENKEELDVEKRKEEKQKKLNHVEVEGKIVKIGNQFKKKDGNLAKFITIQQEYEYKDKIQKNTISVMMEGSILAEYQDELQIDDNIVISGKLNSYVDKNNQNQSVIYCDNIHFLDKNNDIEIER